MVQTLENTLKIKAEINFMPMQKGDVKNTYADISYAKNKLNYNPKTELKSGIEKTFEWYLNFKSK